MVEQKWPDVLWIVRHGESAGNVARQAANTARPSEAHVPSLLLEELRQALGRRTLRTEHVNPAGEPHKLAG